MSAERPAPTFFLCLPPFQLVLLLSSAIWDYRAHRSFLFVGYARVCHPPVDLLKNMDPSEGLSPTIPTPSQLSAARGRLRATQSRAARSVARPAVGAPDRSAALHARRSMRRQAHEASLAVPNGGLISGTRKRSLEEAAASTEARLSRSRSMERTTVPRHGTAAAETVDEASTSQTLRAKRRKVTRFALPEGAVRKPPPIAFTQRKCGTVGVGTAPAAAADTAAVAAGNKDSGAMRRRPSSVTGRAAAILADDNEDVRAISQAVLHRPATPHNMMAMIIAAHQDSPHLYQRFENLSPNLDEYGSAYAAMAASALPAGRTSARSTPDAGGNRPLLPPNLSRMADRDGLKESEPSSIYDFVSPMAMP